MLIDYIDHERLPWVIVWLDWNIYAYRASMAFIILSFIILYGLQTPMKHWNLAGASVAIYVGFSAWCVYCYLRYGNAVG